jgi:hypothetical protein
MDVKDNLARVRERIAKACAASQRDVSSVTLVAVSKTKPAEMIRAAYEAGQRDFAENYAQELRAKAEVLSDLKDIRWHFVGRLQSNKAKIVAPRAFMVHSVDSASLAKELAKRAPRKLPVLAEVNVGGEASKSGVKPDDLDPLLEAIRREPNLDLVGLMTMPPPGDLEVARRCFETLAKLRADRGLRDLSMGMTEDLEVAIACGATIVRVGTGVFGAR